MWFKSSVTIPAVVAVGLCLIGGTSPATADVLHVPGEYLTIQAAIDAAVNGDEVIVADGIYTGEGNRDIDFGGKLITVRSENGHELRIMVALAAVGHGATVISYATAYRLLRFGQVRRCDDAVQIIQN